MENNTIIIRGTLSEWQIRKIKNNLFYYNNVITPRKSGFNDQIPIYTDFCNRIVNTIGKQCKIAIQGQIRALWSNKKKTMYVYATSITATNNENSENKVGLIGYVCTNPTYRSTTKQKRKISDFTIKVDDKTYIPCISWGNNALYCYNNIEKGDYVKINGRFQSREYIKPLDNNNFEKKTTYEVSISRISKL